MTQQTLRQPSLFDAAESSRRKAAGISRAASGHAAWLAEAREVAVRIASRTGSVTADDVRAAGVLTPEGASPNCWGALFNDKRFVFVDLVKSARPEAHSNLLRRWRLAD